MKKYSHYILILFILIQSGIAFSQNQGQPVIDSLHRMLVLAKEDTNKVHLLERLSAAYYPISPDTGIIYGNESIVLGKKLRWDKLLGWGYNSIGVNYWAKSDFTLAMEYYLKALKFGETRKDSLLITAVLGNISTIHFDQGEYQKSLETDLRVIALFERLGDKVAVARNMGNVAQTYHQLKNDQKAIEYYNKALALNEQLGRKLSMAHNLQGLAGIYSDRNENFKALEYNLKALKLNKDINNKKGIATCFHSIAKNYLAIVIAEKNNSLKNYSSVQSKKYLQLAQFYIDSSTTLNESIGSLASLSANYKTMARIKELTEDYKGALAAQKKYMQLKDSVFILENDKKITEQLMQYEFDKKMELEKATQELKDAKVRRTRNLQYTAIGLVLLVTGFLYWNYRQQQKRKTEVEKAYTELKSTQASLIQSEKMASLGELTAGIAHEIQNPLNFVNNFSEVSTELIKELVEEAEKGNTDEVKLLAGDLSGNLQKIHHHGERAASIVKGMLQHSRTSSGQKELTDINALCDEYLRLAYHGMRAKDKSFNASFTSEFDERVGSINIVPQDMGRVILNLINNAFYAVNEKKNSATDYTPAVSIKTVRKENAVLISVADNGNGIPKKVLDKIFQPFFTTKPTGEGTGLGLSLSYDIVKAHGGELKVETKETSGTVFTIILSV